MQIPSTRLRYLAPSAVLGALGALFLAQIVAIARYRLDYPIVDDWRYYNPRGGMPSTLSVEWLFAPARDTLHATGKLLDWCIFNGVSHDYNVLATLSFVLFLGGWLSASVAVCWRAVGRQPRILAMVLSVFLLGLAGAPYWVTVSPHQYLEPMIAYHQMLPMVAMAVLALLCVSNAGLRGQRAQLVCAVLVTGFFGFSYSSGGVALFLFGAAMLAASAIARTGNGGRDPFPHLVLAITAVAGVCLVLHVWLPFAAHDANPITESRVHELTPAWRFEFWQFLFGLHDRAVLSTALGWTSTLRGIVVLAIAALPILGLTIRLARAEFDERQRTLAIVLIGLLTAVLGYAALVSYGRAGFGDRYFAELLETSERVGLYAHSRFFYWWITASLPLALVGWWLCLEGRVTRHRMELTIAVLAIFLLVPKGQSTEGEHGYLHHWRYSALYQRDAQEVSDLIDRDVKRIRGEYRNSKRYESWLALDSARRNPQYRRGETKIVTLPVRIPIYRNAKRQGATFVERWDLKRKR
jgi:hypothetical protein